MTSVSSHELARDCRDRSFPRREATAHDVAAGPREGNRAGDGDSSSHRASQLSKRQERTHASDTDSVARIGRAGAGGRCEEPAGPARRPAMRGVRPPRRRAELNARALCGRTGRPLSPAGATVGARPGPAGRCQPVLVLHRRLHRLRAPAMRRGPGHARARCGDHHAMLRRMVSVSLDRSLPRPARYPGMRLLPVVAQVVVTALGRT